MAVTLITLLDLWQTSRGTFGAETSAPVTLSAAIVSARPFASWRLRIVPSIKHHRNIINESHVVARLDWFGNEHIRQNAED